ncbi:LCP family protein [Bacillus sp. H-16]|uniref:LCP family glycopolymer transferase n=1 Tax=Alteribacter salitolerans TaxID=2912333 RepID=UPI001962D446|nr:LCP family protein [Alteribacter salitolerans]MBM7095666.1 LCP family protein [Alteribacter salitolerans]
MGKKILLITLTFAVVLVVGAGGYVWQAVNATIGSIQENIDRNQSEKRQEAIDLEEGDPVSILLMGVDELETRDDLGRTDTMLLLTVNPKEESINMVSLPRDTLTEIRGQRTEDKISHAHAMGGSETALYTVEHFLDIPVDYFVKVNMESFVGLVDAIDGVEVDNEFEFIFHEMHYPEGKIKLDGEEALGYARMRKDDPKGDFGRQMRQREVIEEIIDKGASFSSITNLTDILEVVEDNVQTNLSLDEMWDIQSNYKNTINDVEQHEIKGEDRKMDGISYFFTDEDELESLSDELKQHLEVEE